MREPVVSAILSEIDELRAGITSYGDRVFKIFAGSMATALLVVWYAIQQPGSARLLCFIVSMAVHPVIIYLTHCYVVYRTLKTIKAAQTRRLNFILDKERPSMLWEDSWHAIWSGGHGIRHALLAWVLYALFLIALIPLLAFVTCEGAAYLALRGTGGPLVALYVSLIVIACALEVAVPFLCMRLVNRAVSESAQLPPPGVEEHHGKGTVS